MTEMFRLVMLSLAAMSACAPASTPFAPLPVENSADANMAGYWSGSFVDLAGGANDIYPASVEVHIALAGAGFVIEGICPDGSGSVVPEAYYRGLIQFGDMWHECPALRKECGDVSVVVTGGGVGLFTGETTRVVLYTRISQCGGPPVTANLIGEMRRSTGVR